jgi:hypothetical protein
MRRRAQVLAIVMVALPILALAAPAAAAEEEKTVLTYSVRDARAFLWQIHYPQSTFVTEFYDPCNTEDEYLPGSPKGAPPSDAADTYGCDRTRYNQEEGSCKNLALGLEGEAPETPTPEEAADGGLGVADAESTEAPDVPRGNPVTVLHGLALGRLGSTPEAGGLASMYYVDNSGRRETEAHVESDAFVSNRRPYEERCAIVDAFSEGGMYDGPFNAHMLSRSSADDLETYNMAAYTPAGDTGRGVVGMPTPPGAPTNGVSIVKLWEAGGRVNGLLTSTVRGLSIGGGALTIDVIRSIIWFSSDGTKAGLQVAAKTEALGLRAGGSKLASLAPNTVIPLEDGAKIGILGPYLRVADDGTQLTVRAPGVFVAATTPLDQIPIPEDPFNREGVPEQLKGNLTLGGQLNAEQVVYVGGAILDAGLGRVPDFSFIPRLPTIPNLPPPPGIIPPPPGIIPPPLPPAAPVQPVGVARFELQELSGSPWPLVFIMVATMIGLLGVMGRWSMRWPWARALAQTPPFPAFSWAYRAFLKD